MRKNHIIGGSGVFALGLLLLYFFGPYTIEFLKGALQPVLILIGLVAAAAVFMGNEEFRKVNIFVAVIFLFLGFYGLYDEYYAVIDLICGIFPPLFIAIGLVAVIHGIGKLS